MADEEKAAEAEGEEGEGAAAPARRRIQINPRIILPILNTVLVLTAAGTFAYTKLLYKKPVISEYDELAKQKEALKKPEKPVEKPLVNFEQMTINVAPTSGKAHFATIKLSIEARDADASKAAAQLKDAMTDRLIASLARKQLSELNTIQGKLLLKAELLREFNGVLNASARIGAGITDVYFSTFILQ